MAEPSNKKMDPDFVIRTLKLIKDYDNYCVEKNISEHHDLKFTLLINCLLWLLVFAKERPMNKALLQEDIFKIKEISWIKSELSRVWIRKLEIWKFLSHFRNAISHMCIKAVIYNEWDKTRRKIEIWDKNPKTKKITLQKITLSYQEILIFSKIIARRYIKK